MGCTSKFLTNYLTEVTIEKDIHHGNVEFHSQMWSAPAEGFWKINVDAARFEGVGSGMGAVIRNNEGVVERVGVKKVSLQWSVDIIEAKAAIFGLKLAIQMRATKVILESDSLQLISTIKEKKIPSSYFGNVVSEIVELCDFFESISFSFIKRSGNVAAHIMAYYSPLEFSTRVWIDMCPEMIADVVAVDSIADLSS
ncbi:hypothetical protein vseg_013398 [Gypsophila vaccaria]